MKMQGRALVYKTVSGNYLTKSRLRRMASPGAAGMATTDPQVDSIATAVPEEFHNTGQPSLGLSVIHFHIKSDTTDQLRRASAHSLCK